MRFTIAKDGSGKFNIYVKRTRREEKRGTPEFNVPQDQVGDAVKAIADKMRVFRQPGLPGT